MSATAQVKVTRHFNASTERVFDVPDGKGGRTWRYTRPPAPMRLTLVNGVPTFDRDRFDGTYPGMLISTTAPLAKVGA